MILQMNHLHLFDTMFYNKNQICMYVFMNVCVRTNSLKFSELKVSYKEKIIIREEEEFMQTVACQQNMNEREFFSKNI